MSERNDPSTIAHAHAIRRSAQSWEIRITSGPADVDGKLAKKTLTVSARSPGRLLVGTSEACDLRLVDRRISRRHLALETTEEGLRVTDLGSTNGTWVAGLRVKEAFCQGGEVIAIGDTTLAVDVGQTVVDAPDVRMSFGPLVGASLAMRRLYRTCDVLAASLAPLVIEGEVGTGKMLLAEAIHLASTRAKGPFIVVEGARAEEITTDGGVAALAEAKGGVLFVSAIEAAPLDVQAALAKLATDAAGHDVRFVASTRENLDRLVERGAFREELARALVTRIELPPLRERRGDIALLVERFCKDLGAMSASIPARKLADLNRHDFPGNVRELRRTVANLVADAGAEIGPGAIERSGDTAPSPVELGVEISYRDILEERPPFAEAKQRVLDRFTDAYVTVVVAAHGGHVARAAAASGLAPRYFNLLRARSRAR
jgi:two-component system, NtrC family, response regulator HydG